MSEEVKEEFKTILKEELSVTLDNLKVKGIDIGKRALEETALEISDLLARVAKRTDNNIDDFYLMVKGMLDEKLKEIHVEKEA